MASTAHLPPSVSRENRREPAVAKKKCPLVLIEWEDSMRPQPAWTHLAALRDAPAPTLCASVGWLLHDTKRVKVLAPNMGGIEGAGDNAQASGMMTIPTRCVLRVKRLKE